MNIIGSPEQNERMNKDIKRGRINFNFKGGLFPDPYWEMNLLQIIINGFNIFVVEIII